jgi:hypothetical protein
MSDEIIKKQGLYSTFETKKLATRILILAPEMECYMFALKGPVYLSYTRTSSSLSTGKDPSYFPFPEPKIKLHSQQRSLQSQ